MELVRKILMRSAENSSTEPLTDISFDSYTPDVVKYHIKLLVDAGLLDGVIEHVKQWGNRPGVMIGTRFPYAIGNLTWEGQDFVDASRDPTIWQKVMDNVIKPAGSWTFQIVLAYLKAEAMRRLGIK